MASDLIDFAPCEFGVHKHWPGVDACQSEQDGDKCPAIFANNDYPVARAHAGLD